MLRFKDAKIRTKLLSQIFLVLLLIFASFYFLITYIENSFIDAKVDEEVQYIKSMFDDSYKQDILTLSSTLEVFLQNEEFKKIFLEKDREKLYQYGQTLFNNLKNKYGITHFYFHLPDGHNFVRLHNKNVYGDKIERITFKQAEKTKNIGAGIELGKTAYALRVVKPYYYNDELIGYIELGEGIDYFLKKFKKEDNIKFAIVAHKEYFSQEEWEAFKKESGEDNNWSNMESHLILNDISINRENENCFQDQNIELANSDVFFIEKFRSHNKIFVCAGIPILNSSSEGIGTVLMLDGTSSFVATLSHNRAIFLIISLIFFIISFLFLRSLILKIVIKPIVEMKNVFAKIAQGDLNRKVKIRSRDAIGQLGISFNQMTNKLIDTLKESERSHKELNILKQILKSAHKTKDAKEYATNALDAVLNIDFFKIQDKGCIFLLDKENDQLVLSAHKGFDEAFAKQEAIVPVGDCLCGKVAQTGEFYASESCKDNLAHTRKCPNYSNHGHYIVPLKGIAGQMVGVLCIYVTPHSLGDNRTKEFISFLGERIGRILESIILKEKLVTLQESKIRGFNIIFENSKDAIFWIDGNTKLITRCNKAAEILLEKKREDMIGNPLTIIFPKDKAELYLEEFKKHIKSKSPAIEQEVIAKFEKIVPVRLSASLVEINNDSIIQAIFRDITREKEIDEIKTEFISVASHQLRTPLTSIRWFLELLMNKSTGDLNPKQKDYCNQMFFSLEKIIELVGYLLEISRVGPRDSVSIKKEKKDIIKIVDQAVKDSISLAKHKNVKVIKHKDMPESLEFYVDESRVRQIFHNLINNAIKYSQDNSEIEINCNEKDGKIEFYVKDYGIGMPQDSQKRIFDKFFRAQNAIDCKSDGTGLGLYIAQMIAEAHNGKMWFESKEGIGTTFYFSLG